MVRAPLVKLVALTALVLVMIVTAYRAGATTSARPVVRQQIVRRLDPDVPDLVTDLHIAEPILVSDADWRVHEGFDVAWVIQDFDDSDWSNASSLGSNGLAAIVGETGVEAIWSSHTSGTGHSPVTFRRSLDIDSPIGLLLLVTCDNDFRLYVNGIFVSADPDGSWTSVAVFDVSQILRQGRNLVAIQGIDADGSTIGMACAVAPRSANPADRAVDIPLNGSRWAVVSAPGVSAQRRVTVDLELLTHDRSWDLFPELTGMRDVMPIVPVRVRDGQVLVQLTNGRRDGNQPLIQPGTYRLIVDTVAD